MVHWYLQKTRYLGGPGAGCNRPFNPGPGGLRTRIFVRNCGLIAHAVRGMLGEGESA